MDIRGQYDNWSENYDTDSNLTRDLDREVTEKTLAGRRFDVVLEAGCGTGKNTVLLASIGKRVDALDFSAAMIARARDKLSLPNVSYTITNLNEPWPCESESYGLVSCNLVLEHIENINFVFVEAARCLADSGLLFVCELHPFKQYRGTRARFTAGQATIHIDAYVHHVSDYLSAAGSAGMQLLELDEWWHEEDVDKPPRLLSLLFSK